jgi:hypothetical protein
MDVVVPRLGLLAHHPKAGGDGGNIAKTLPHEIGKWAELGKLNSALSSAIGAGEN